MRKPTMYFTISNRFQLSIMELMMLYLLQLNRAVEVGFINVRSICLPQGEAVYNDLECVVAGWGTSK